MQQITIKRNWYLSLIDLVIDRVVNKNIESYGKREEYRD